MTHPAGICAVCSNNEIRIQVDQWLDSREISQLEISRRVGISDSAISRHKHRHWHKGRKLGFFNEGDEWYASYSPDTPPPNVRLPHGACLWEVLVTYEPPLPEKLPTPENQSTNLDCDSETSETIPAENLEPQT